MLLVICDEEPTSDEKVKVYSAPNLLKVINKGEKIEIAYVNWDSIMPTDKSFIEKLKKSETIGDDKPKNLSILEKAYYDILRKNNLTDLPNYEFETKVTTLFIERLNRYFLDCGVSEVLPALSTEVLTPECVDRLRKLEAWRNIKVLAQNPSDRTEQTISLLESISYSDFKRLQKYATGIYLAKKFIER